MPGADPGRRCAPPCPLTARRGRAGGPGYFLLRRVRRPLLPRPSGGCGGGRRHCSSGRPVSGRDLLPGHPDPPPGPVPGRAASGGPGGTPGEYPLLDGLHRGGAPHPGRPPHRPAGAGRGRRGGTGAGCGRPVCRRGPGAPEPRPHRPAPAGRRGLCHGRGGLQGQPARRVRRGGLPREGGPPAHHRGGRRGGSRTGGLPGGNLPCSITLPPWRA